MSSAKSRRTLTKLNPPWIGGKDWTYRQFIILLRKFVTFHCLFCLFITLRKSECYARNILHSTRMIFPSEISRAVNETRIFIEFQFQSKHSELPAISTMSSEWLLERSNMPWQEPRIFQPLSQGSCGFSGTTSMFNVLEFLIIISMYSKTSWGNRKFRWKIKIKLFAPFYFRPHLGSGDAVV